MAHECDHWDCPDCLSLSPLFGSIRPCYFCSHEFYLKKMFEVVDTENNLDVLACADCADILLSEKSESKGILTDGTR